MIAFQALAHAFLGELALLLFLAVTVIILVKPSDEALEKAKKIALFGLIMLLLTWLSAGNYYVNVYGSQVKPTIKSSPFKWAHSIGMETKEHVFLMLPFLGFVSYMLLLRKKKELIENESLRKQVLLLNLLIVLIALSMTGFGAIISNAARYALQVKLL